MLSLTSQLSALFFLKHKIRFTEDQTPSRAQSMACGEHRVIASPGLVCFLSPSGSPDRTRQSLSPSSVLAASSLLSVAWIYSFCIVHRGRAVDCAVVCGMMLLHSPWCRVSQR